VRSRARIAAVLLLIGVLLPAILSACPLCKDAEADAPGGSASLGRGFYYSILLMIAVPWTAVGTVAFLIFRRRRRDRAALPGGVASLVPDSRGARS
jgi:heme/copper-type cytochrome/quinol oxidase subunit 2